MHENPHSEHQQLQRRVEGGLSRLEARQPLPLRRHFALTRHGGDMRIRCWCGAARILGLSYASVFTQDLDTFLYEHDRCQAKEGP